MAERMPVLASMPSFQRTLEALVVHSRLKSVNKINLSSRA